jgi:hypothetical protein
MAKFFRNIRANLIEEVENESVIDEMSRYPEVYEEVEDPTKAKKKAGPKEQAPEAEESEKAEPRAKK